MPHKKNPRRVVLADLRTINARMRAVVARWNVTGTVHLLPSERGGYGPEHGPWTRERKFHEYPENRIESWEGLINDMQYVIAYATALQNFAKGNITNLKSEIAFDEAYGGPDA